jgi:hypothetical protein
MGTRGVYGFRFRGQDKVTYNHFDSYPSYLGGLVLEFIQKTPAGDMRDIFDRITLVKDNDPKDAPSEALQREYLEYFDETVAEGRKTDWYCLLRRAQGDLGVYARGVRHMIDSKEFLKDSLFCEYGYIVNLDAEALEFWLGFQKEPDPGCRYGTSRNESGYYPCRMAGAFTLGDIRGKSIEEGIDILNALEGKRTENDPACQAWSL